MSHNAPGLTHANESQETRTALTPVLYMPVGTKADHPTPFDIPPAEGQDHCVPHYCNNGHRFNLAPGRKLRLKHTALKRPRGLTGGDAGVVPDRFKSSLNVTQVSGLRSLNGLLRLNRLYRGRRLGSDGVKRALIKSGLRISGRFIRRRLITAFLIGRGRRVSIACSLKAGPRVCRFCANRGGLLSIFQSILNSNINAEHAREKERKAEQSESTYPK